MMKFLRILSFSFLILWSLAGTAKADYTFFIKAVQMDETFDISPFSSQRTLLQPGPEYPASFFWYDANNKDDSVILGRSAIISCYPVSDYQGTFVKKYGPFATYNQELTWEVPLNSITIAGNPKNCYCRLNIYQDQNASQLLYQSSEFKICKDAPGVRPYIETLSAQKDENNSSINFLRADFEGNGSDIGLPKVWFDIFKKNTPYRISGNNQYEKGNTVRIYDQNADTWKGKELWRPTRILITDANNYCYQASASNIVGITAGKTICNQKDKLIEITKPKAVVNTAFNITNNSAELSADILDLGNDPDGVDVWFVYNEMTAKDDSTAKTTILKNRKTYKTLGLAKEKITDLKPCTSYYFYPVVHNDWGYQLDKNNPFYFTTTGGEECTKWVETTDFDFNRDIHLDASSKQPKLYLDVWGRVYKFGAETTSKKGYAWFFWDTLANSNKGILSKQSPSPKILKTINPGSDILGQAFTTRLPIDYYQTYCWKAAVDNMAGVEQKAKNLICSDMIRPLKTEAQGVEVLGISSVRLIGVMESNGGFDGFTKVKFQYWPCDKPEVTPGEDYKMSDVLDIDFKKLKDQNKKGDVTFSTELYNLTEGRGYCFRAIAQNGKNDPYYGLIGRFFNTKKNPYVVTCDYVSPGTPQSSRADNPICNITEDSTYATNVALQGIVDKKVISDQRLETWFQLWEARMKKIPEVQALVPDCQILPEPNDPSYWPQVGYKKGSRNEFLITVGSPELKRDTVYCARFVARNEIGAQFGEIITFNTKTQQPKIAVDDYIEKNVVPVANPLKPGMVSYNVTGNLLDNGGAQNPGADIFVYWWVDGEIPRASHADPIKDPFFAANPHRESFASVRSNGPFVVKIGNDHIEMDKVYYFAVYARNLSVYDNFKRRYSNPQLRTIYRIGPQIETLDPMTLIGGKNILRAKIIKMGPDPNPVVFFRICSFASQSNLAQLDVGYECKDFQTEAKNLMAQGVPGVNKTLETILWAQEIRSKIKWEEGTTKPDDLASMVATINRYGYEIQACIKARCGNNNLFCIQCGERKTFYSLTEVPHFSQLDSEIANCPYLNGSTCVSEVGCGDTSMSMALSFWYKNDKKFKDTWDNLYAQIPSKYSLGNADICHDYALPEQWKNMPTPFKYLRYLKYKYAPSASSAVGDRDWICAMNNDFGLDTTFTTVAEGETVSSRKMELLSNLGIPLPTRCQSSSKWNTHYIVFWRPDNLAGNINIFKVNDPAASAPVRNVYGPMTYDKTTINASLPYQCATSIYNTMGMQNFAIYPTTLRSKVFSLINIERTTQILKNLDCPRR